MSAADRIKLIEADAVVPGKSNVKPGYIRIKRFREKSYYRALKRGDAWAKNEQQHRELLRLVSYAMEEWLYRPNPFTRLINKPLKSDNYFGLDRYVPCERLKNDPQVSSPNFFRRLIDRIRAWALHRS